MIHPGSGLVSDRVDYATDSSNDTEYFERDSDSDYATHSSNHTEYVERDSDSDALRFERVARI